MPFTHHSHSGQFCSHARNTLEQMLSRGIELRMSVMALTEHVPRGNADLYDEEIAEGTDEAELTRRFDDYVAEALRLRKSEMIKASDVVVLVGFEGEWIQADECGAQWRYLQEKYDNVFDFFVGSVHHVAGEPIDLDRTRYENARDKCGGTEAGIFEAYYDAQYKMLNALKPRVVGHFDLIRLMSDQPNINLNQGTHGGKRGLIWRKIIRNLELVKSYGGVLECNSSGLRKGLKEPYPAKAICESWNSMGGSFVLSDDSHSVEQVGICYKEAVDFLKCCKVEDLAFLSKEGAETVIRNVRISTVETMPFWTAAERSKT